MTIETELRETLQGRAMAEPAVPGDLDEVRRHGRRKQRGHLAVGLAGVVAVVAVGFGAASTFAGTGTPLPTLGGGTEAREEGDVDAFCSLLTDLDRAPTTELGGNYAHELTELHGVTPGALRDDVRVVRDYHRDTYVEGDGVTDLFENWPDEAQAAVERIEAFANTNCEGYGPGDVVDGEPEGRAP